MTSSMDDRTQHDWKPTHRPAAEKLAPKMWARQNALIEKYYITDSDWDYKLLEEIGKAAHILERIDDSYTAEFGYTVIHTMPTPERQEAILRALLFDLRLTEDVYATAVDDWAAGCIDCPMDIVNVARIAADLAGDRYRRAMVAYGRMPFRGPIEPIEF